MRDTNGTSPSEDLIDYRLWHRHLEQAGFRQVWRSHDTFDPKNKPWSRFLYHSAWVRTTNTSYKQDENHCQLHKRAQGLSNEHLHCSTLHEGPWDPGKHVLQQQAVQRRDRCAPVSGSRHLQRPHGFEQPSIRDTRAALVA